MTSATSFVEVPIPEGAHLTAEELEILERTLSTFVNVRLDPSHEWSGIRRALERNGWSVRWGMQWHVMARRGRELEEACGSTLDDAFAQIWQVTREDQPLEGTP